MGEKLIHIYELEKLAASTIVFLILGKKHRVYPTPLITPPITNTMNQNHPVSEETS